MRIRPECVRDIEEDINCTTRREPIRRLDFYPRPLGCGYRYRREPFIPQTPTYVHDEWPFFTLDEPNIVESVHELDVYDIDIAINPRHDRRLTAAQALGEAIHAYLVELEDIDP